MSLPKSTILVTGGAGYVGSHSVLLLLQQDYQVVVVDSCVNAYIAPSNNTDSNGNQLDSDLPESLRRVEELAGQRLVAFYKLDLNQDGATGPLDNVFRKHKIDAVIHFAALKSVSESISKPLEYYTNNLIGTINLLNTMRRNGCRNLIFSSSATVYGLPQYLPVDESHQVGLNVLNPYGRTKYMIEQILQDLALAKGDSDSGQDSAWSIIALRYFNPVGAHPSGYIGEHTQGVPNNLMPYVTQVGFGKRDKLYVFGDDFDTKDGTGVRDFIHIMDLASGHTHALDYLLRNSLNTTDSSSSKGTNCKFGFKVYNLGTGRGYSVLETIRTFEQINSVRVPYEVIGRREGDAGEVYADASSAERELGWSSKYTIIEMCRDAYRWQRTYPDGFKSPPNKGLEPSIKAYEQKHQ